MKIWRVAMAGVAAVMAVTTTVRADLSSGVISYWPLDEIDNGNTTPDLASGNVVTITGGLSVVPGGVFSNAFSFPNTLSYFSISSGSASGLPIFKSASGYTVSFWIKALPQLNRYIFTESAAPTGNALFLIQTGMTAAVQSNLDLYVRNDAAAAQVNHITSSSNVLDNTWHHVAWVDNHGKTALYVDGIMDTKAGLTNYTPTGTYTLNKTSVGALVRGSASTNTFTGLLDNVAIWQRPLSQAEVQNFMSNSIPLPIVQTPPVVQSISPSSTNMAGDYIILSETVQGAFPLTYQWYQGGSALSGQNSNSLTLTTLTNSGTYVYTIIASNPLGIASNNITITVPPDPTNSVSSGLVSYWPLDTVNTSSSNVMTTPDLYSHDDFTLASGNGGGAPAITGGQFANALAFDGSQLDYAGFAGGSAIFNNAAYSVSLWVAGQPGSQTRVFSESSTTSGNPLFTIGTDTTGFLQFASILIRNDAGSVFLNNLDSSGIAFDGNWHHIVWVDRNGHALLYIDGVLDPVSFSYSRTGTFSLNELSIGAIVRSTVGNAFSGSIDDVGIWNRALTYSEIQQLQTATPPPPTAILPPVITSFASAPVDTTNNLIAGDALTFTAQASGTAPLFYQWLKNGQPIPSATNAILSIPSTQGSDSGAYTLTISNGDPVLPGGGVATSQVQQVTVQVFTAITNGLAFDADVDMLGSPNTQPGFLMFNTSLSGVAYTNANGIRVTIAGIGAGVLADRDRIAPPEVVNGGAITQAQLYNDFIFVNTTNVGAGMTILLEHLATNTTYGVTLWSFDTYSAGARISDWYEISSGTALPLGAPYSFNGSVLPTADYDNTIGGLFTSTSGGKLQLRGTNDAANANAVAVFFDAIQLVANPVVTVTSATRALDGNFQITAQGQYPGQTLTFITSPDLTPGSWQSVSNAVVTAVHGPNTTVEIPFTANQQFFRAVASH